MIKYGHEGVKKGIRIKTNIKTTGKTVHVYAYDKLDPDATGVDLAQIPGGPADTWIYVVLSDTDQLPVGAYLIEAWIDPESENKKCIYPSDDEEHVYVVTDRRKVTV